MAAVQVNEATTGNQQRGDVVVLPDGTIVIVWEDFSGQGGDASAPGVKLRLYSPTLQPLGGEALVNTTTTDGQNQPQVAARDGGFVVVWTDASKGRTLAGGGVDSDIRAQLYTAAGGKVGGEILITSEMRNEALPAVATLADGGFAVAWQSFPELGVRTYDANGVLRGSAVADGTPQGALEITPSGAGFLVAFNTNSGIRVQAFSASATPLAPAKVFAGSSFVMDVLALDGGGYVLAYGGNQGRATVQVFGADGALVGPATEVVPGDQRVLSAVLARSDEGFDVVVRVGNGGPYALRVRGFDAAGQPLGASEALATGVSSAVDPAVAVGPDGALLTVFTGGTGDGATELYALGQAASTPGGNTPSAGDDQLKGTANGDTIDGLGGADLVEGFEGDDVLSGSGGNDWLVGGVGNDQLDPGDGVNVLDGGDGLDFASFASRAVGVWADLAAGAFSDATTWATYRSIEGLIGSSAADALFGDGNANTLRGGAGGDALDGRAGTDVLEGGDGDDYLVGGDGTDILRGGAGVDTLTGGAGADLFDLGAAAGWDVATDFDAGQGDRIQLGAGQAFQFLVERDANGDGVADTQLSWSGGTFVALGVSGLDLAAWNALVV